MLKTLKRITAAIMITALLLGTVFVMPAEAAGLGQTKNCRFAKWLKSDYSACRIIWDKVKNANAYYVEVAYPNGKSKNHYLIRHRYINLKNLSRSVRRVRVKACRVNSKNKILKTGSYSNVAFITPLPTLQSASITNQSKRYVKLGWSKVYNSSGYNLFLTTNPKGKWFWNQNTAAKASATSAVIKKYRGSALKYYQNYYCRVVTRLKINGTFRNVPIPSSSFYSGGFYIRKIYY